MLLRVEGSEGTRRLFSIYKGMGGWDTQKELQLFGPLEMRNASVVAVLPVTIWPSLAVSTNALTAGGLEESANP